MLDRWIARPLGTFLAGLPSQCVVCRAWPSRPVCDDCAARFARPMARCPTCALPVPTGVERCAECMRSPSPLDACLAACSYVWPWPQCIADFKLRGDAGQAGPLAALLRSAPWVEPALEQADLVLPLPLTDARLRERGFNQAWELARRLEPRKAYATLLRRTLETTAQKTLGRRERLLNLQGAFELDPARPEAVRGLRLVLVDDVMTSGGTLFAAATLLREAGAAHITAVVLARTDAPG